MSTFALLTLLAYPAVAVSLFAYMHPRRAVLAAFTVSWLFLPNGSISLSGVIPPYDKTVAASLGVFFGMLLYDTDRLARIRFGLVDIPIIAWSLCPFISSFANGLGMYDGASAIVRGVPQWLMPYMFGRVYIRDLDDLRDLALAIFFGGLVYMPICWFELRMSPQLHRMVYGYSHIEFVHVMRYGGFRPVGFAPGGLALGLWMASASLIGLALWQTRAVRFVWHVPMWAWVGLLWLTTLATKAIGAVGLLMMCTGAYFLTRVIRTRILLLCMILVVPSYLFLRVAGDWHGENVVQLVKDVLDVNRAGSLETRLKNEARIIEKTSSHAIVGLGGWGRSRITDDSGYDVTITDSLWIIAYGQSGLVGMASVFAMMLLPVLLIAWVVRERSWSMQMFWILLAVTLTGWMFTVDKLVNALPNPVFILMFGALTSVAAGLAKRAANPRLGALAGTGVTANTPVAQNRVR